LLRNDNERYEIPQGRLTKQTNKTDYSEQKDVTKTQQDMQKYSENPFLRPSQKNMQLPTKPLVIKKTELPYNLLDSGELDAYVSPFLDLASVNQDD